MIRASDGEWWHHSKGTHGRNALDYKLPMGMEEYLDRYPETTRVYIHFDNDNPGRVAGQRLQEALEKKGIQAVQQYPPTGCKDVNDYLVGMNRLQTDRGKNLEAGL